MVPDPKAQLEQTEPYAAPHVLVAGHRWHARLHPLPAGRYLQRVDAASAACACRTQLRRSRRRQYVDGTIRFRKRRRRSHPRHDGALPTHARSRGPAAHRHRVTRRVLCGRRSRLSRRRHMGWRAVLRDAPRHLYLAGQDQGRQPSQRSAPWRGRAVVIARRSALEQRSRRLSPCRTRAGMARSAHAAVPRHHPRFVYRVGARRCRSGIHPPRCFAHRVAPCCTGIAGTNGWRRCAARQLGTRRAHRRGADPCRAEPRCGAPACSVAARWPARCMGRASLNGRCRHLVRCPHASATSLCGHRRANRHQHHACQRNRAHQRRLRRIDFIALRPARRARSDQARHACQPARTLGRSSHRIRRLGPRRLLRQEHPRTHRTRLDRDPRPRSATGHCSDHAHVRCLTHRAATRAVRWVGSP